MDNEYQFDWTKYPILSGYIFDAAGHTELRALLRAARADAVQFVEDANAVALRDEYQRGWDNAMDTVAPDSTG